MGLGKVQTHEGNIPEGASDGNGGQKVMGSAHYWQGYAFPTRFRGTELPKFDRIDFRGWV